MRVLIIGGTGRIGAATVAAAEERGHTVVFTSRDGSAGGFAFDLRDPASAHPEGADCAINCAAVTKAFDCERDPATAWRVNVDAPMALARRFPRFVQLSSDAVEFALATTYGRHKAFMEMGLAGMANVLTIRLPRIGAPHAAARAIVEAAEGSATGLLRLSF